MQTTDRRDIVGLAKETGVGVQATAERVQGLIEKFGSGRVIAEYDHVLHDHTLTAEGADMLRELARAAEALAKVDVSAARQGLYGDVARLYSVEEIANMSDEDVTLAAAARGLMED